MEKHSFKLLKKLEKLLLKNSVRSIRLMQKRLLLRVQKAHRLNLKFYYHRGI